MKMNFNGSTISVLICSFIFFFEFAEASHINFFPRVDAGIMDYSIEYAASGKATPSMPGQLSGFNETDNGATYSDNMYFVGGGATLSINRFFLDLSGHYAYGGNSTAQSTYSSYIQKEDGGTNLSGAKFFSRARFDHTDRAIAFGYAIGRDLSAFVGYKWADVDFKTAHDGLFKGFFPDVAAMSKASLHVDRDVRFKYEGPFIGVKRGLEIDRFRYLKGMVSIKLALAYLNSRYTRVQHVRSHDFFDDTIESWTDREETKGDTWGFSLGLGWRGNTPIRNLTYALNVGGYRYHFNHDNDIIGEISETVLNYKAEIAYAF